jgi:formylglycine-generating enzyme required for sulfatase activity
VESALREWRVRHAPATPLSHAPSIAPSAPPDLDREIANYLDKTAALHATIPIAGFKTKLRVPIELADLYVPLRAMVDLRGSGGARFADAADAEKRLHETDAGKEIDLAGAFAEADRRGRKGLAILGDPGSGKTTHLKRLLIGCLKEGPVKFGLPQDALPIFLPLRDLADLAHGLDAFIQAQLQDPQLEMSPDFGRRLLDRGNLLFLLDGLDEVADPSRRAQVSRWIEGALIARPTCRYVVTCRFAGYTDEARLCEKFLELHIRPLTEEQAGRFVRNWYRIVERGLAKDPKQGEVTGRQNAEALIARLKEPAFRARRVFELTRNPLLLANLCLVHRDRGQLPRHRSKLYDECIDVLLERWREGMMMKTEVTAEQGRLVLQPAALWLHEVENRTRATVVELTPVVEPALKSIQYPRGAADFFHAIRDESGLLTGWGGDSYGFMHLGFQENLAACEICSRSFADKSVLRELASRFGASWWQEVILLLLAQKQAGLFEAFMREVVQSPAFAKHPDLVELCLDDAVAVSERPFIELAEAPAGRDAALWDRQLAALKVLEQLKSSDLGRLKAALSRHPSPAIRQWLRGEAIRTVQAIHRTERGGCELVLVPGGRFRMGSPDSEVGRYDSEGPVHEVQVGQFYMGRYTVTNEEYGLFLAANPGEPEPAYWADRKWNQKRQPVVGVSWHEAKKFAEWVGGRLPSEAEWEYACRAGTSTRFYSGDKDEDLDRVGWYDKNSGGRTHSVGEKEPNAFGLYDMHGNVWEWCEDDGHENYQGAPTDGKAWIDNPRGGARVLRGGSWFFFARHCRSAFRLRYVPEARDFNFGFRVVRLSSSPRTS